MAVVYHWKHGWIPLTHEAALQKAHGSHTLAAKYMADAPHATGIKSRQDVAKAVRDLPNVPNTHKADAHRQLIEAAGAHNSHDLLPGQLRTQIKTREDVRTAFERGDKVQFLPAGARDNATARVLINGKDVGQAAALLGPEAKTNGGSTFGLQDVHFPSRSQRVQTPEPTATERAASEARVREHLTKMSDSQLQTYAKFTTGPAKPLIDAELRRRGLK